MPLQVQRIPIYEEEGIANSFHRGRWKNSMKISGFTFARGFRYHSFSIRVENRKVSRGNRLERFRIHRESISKWYYREEIFIGPLVLPLPSPFFRRFLDNMAMIFQNLGMENVCHVEHPKGVNAYRDNINFESTFRYIFHSHSRCSTCYCYIYILCSIITF